MPTRRIHPHHREARSFLRRLGIILTLAGAAFLLVGLVNVFSMFGQPIHGLPDKVWCVFVGALCLGIGVKLLFAGYLGAIQRYVAGEAAPVVGDTFDALAHRAAPGVRALARAVRDEPDGSCPSCAAALPPDARFCPMCGRATRPAIASCAACGTQAKAGERFCAHCGAALGA